MEGESVKNQKRGWTGMMRGALGMSDLRVHGCGPMDYSR
jgi:hypothetical protein